MRAAQPCSNDRLGPILGSGLCLPCISRHPRDEHMNDATTLTSHQGDPSRLDEAYQSDRASLAATGWSPVVVEPVRARRVGFRRRAARAERQRITVPRRASRRVVIADRRVAAVGCMTGGVLMSLGTLLPWIGRSAGSELGIVQPWGQVMVVLGVVIIMAGLAAMFAPANSHVWHLVVALSASSLSIALYLVAKDQVFMSAAGVGFLASVIGGCIGLGSGARGIWLRRAAPTTSAAPS